MVLSQWEHRISPFLKSPPTESPLQFHRLLNSPTSHYTADKLHRLVNLRHDEFSANKISATGKETSGFRRRLIYCLRRLSVC